jgi:hypothetical protein
MHVVNLAMSLTSVPTLARTPRRFSNICLNYASKSPVPTTLLLLPTWICPETKIARRP